MNKKNITLWFSRERFGALMFAASLALVIPVAPAFADGINVGTTSVVSNGNGFSATVSVPVAAPASNIDTTGMAVVGGQGVGGSIGSLGDNGDVANTSYKTGEAPEDAGMSGIHNGITTQNTPSGLPSMQNGLMANGSVNPSNLPEAYGTIGTPFSYGFNTSPPVTTYTYSFGTQGIINGLINTFGGGIITAGPKLQPTATSGVNANTTLNNGY